MGSCSHWHCITQELLMNFRTVKKQERIISLHSHIFMCWFWCGDFGLALLSAWYYEVTWFITQKTESLEERQFLCLPWQTPEFELIWSSEGTAWCNLKIFLSISSIWWYFTSVKVLSSYGSQENSLITSKSANTT